LKVTFLGTGTSQGVPPIGCNSPVCLSDNPKDKRLRCSIYIEHNGTGIIVDTGPDFRYQCLRAGIKKVDAVLYTHEHRDHTAGLDDIRPFCFMNQRPMDIYAHERVQAALKEQYAYIFSGFKYPGIPEVNMHEISKDNKFNVNGTEITPIELLHYKLPVLGFRIEDFVYITDANSISREEKEKLRGTKTLVLSALRKTDHISHFTLHDAMDLAREVGAEQTYFIHMSYEMGFHDEVNEELPEGFQLAYDGQVLDL
jgi:phosphoribosyl 1,2-cyclic phosphate phosphodiesterase